MSYLKYLSYHSIFIQWQLVALLRELYSIVTDLSPNLDGYSLRLVSGFHLPDIFSDENNTNTYENNSKNSWVGH